MGNDLVAGTVKTQGFTERNMKIERQGFANCVALNDALAIVLFAERVSELYGSRVGGVTRAECIVFFQQRAIENWRKGLSCRSGIVEKSLSCPPDTDQIVRRQ